MNWYSRTELLIGKDGVEKLKNSKVAIFGIGGVGSFAAEALGRAGVGCLVLVDYDDICLTNINRQIHATRKTIGKAKVEMMKERLIDINPDIEVIIHKEIYNEETKDRLLTSDLDYIVDAIDMVSSKIDLIIRAQELNIPIISCMGAGNKLDPSRFEIDDIYKTSICPLARVMRYELRKRGVKKLKVVYSKEEPIITNNFNSSDENITENTNRKQTSGSISFVPSAAGLILASAVIRDILVL